MPKVTVFMPAYRHEAYVGAAIESVLNQTYQDFEFLIGDDGSPDRTAEVIAGYTDPRITFFPHRENRGAVFNHRFLLERARGDYVALINSDDLWMPERLAKQAAFLDEHPETVLCSCWAEMVDENGDVLPMGSNVFEQPNRTQAEWLEYFFCHGNCICHPGVLIRRQAYETLHYYHLAMRQLPDFEFWTRMIQLGEFHIVQEPLVAHRRFVHSGENTSTPKTENSIRDVIESYYVLTELIETVPDGLFAQAFRKYFRNPEACSSAELRCERFFLLSSGRYYMPEIYKQAAIMYFFRHYDMEMADILRKSYHYTLNDFYQLSCQVDLLGLLPGTVQQPRVLPSQEELAVNFIRENRLKAVGIALAGKDTFLYRLGRWAYRKFRNTEG